MNKKISLISSLLLSSVFISVAHAELSLGVLGGIANHTTRVRGDALYAFGPQGYFQYPADYNSTNAAAGIFARYLHPISPRFSLGAEGGYTYINLNSTFLRVDDLLGSLPNPSVPVEYFTTKSSGLVTLNAILRIALQPSFSFSIFAGPAWLNTKYIDNDVAHNFRAKTTSDYQLTADTGAEVNWDFAENWSAGMRFDYIYDTRDQTISNVGSLPSGRLPPVPISTTLYKPDVARSGATLYSFTLRYLFTKG